MFSFLKKFFIVLFVAIFGYFCLIYFLGNEGSKIISNENWQDIILRKNFIEKRLSDYAYISNLYHKLNPQQAGEWMFGSYAMATYALTNIAMQYPETANES